MVVRIVVCFLVCWSLNSVSAATAADDGVWSVTIRVDKLLKKAWKEAAVEPAPPASDAQFLRRIFLDLTGVTPTVGEVREFLADQKPNKRSRLIDRILGTPNEPGKPNHATHLANVWRDLMLSRLNNNFRRFGQTAVFDRWLRDHFVDNTPTM